MPAPMLSSSPPVRLSVLGSSGERPRGPSKSSVVPFRPRRSVDFSDASSRPEGSSWDARERYWTGSQQSCSPAGGASAPVSSFPTLRRPDFTPSTTIRGFRPASEPGSARPPTSPTQPSRIAEASHAATGLLTRQFSQDTIGVERHPSQTELQRKLEKCLDKPAAKPLSDAQPAHSKELLRNLQGRHAVFSAPVVARAFDVAAAASTAATHLEACGRTALICADLGLDAHAVSAALLHNVLTASPLTKQQLEKLLPTEVADMIGNVSRISTACTLLQADQTAQEADTAAKLTTMLLAMADVKAVLIVLASRVERLRAGAAQAAAGHVDLKAEAEEGLRVFAPLANRLGVWSLKAKLEDLCFMVLHPERAMQLGAALKQSSLQSREAMAAALTALKRRLDDCGLSYEDLTGRSKNLYGVHKKLARKGVTAASADLSQIFDVRALRLIVSSKADCYAALREVENLWPAVPGRFKDYVRNPKANGYQSLHTVVTGPDGLPIEVQIRTAKMHYIAEYGVAAHWRYKERYSAADKSAYEDYMVGYARWLITWQLELEDGKCRPRGSPPRDTSLASLFPKSGGDRAAEPATLGACAFPEHAPNCRFAQYVHSERFAPLQAPDSDAPVYVVLLNAASPAASAAPSAAAGASSVSSAAAASTAQRGMSLADATAAVQRSLSGPFAADELASLHAPPAAANGPSAVDLGAAAEPTPCITLLPAGTTVGAILAGSIPGIPLPPAARSRLAEVGSSTAESAAPSLRILVNHEEAADPSLLLRHGDAVEIFAADASDAAKTSIPGSGAQPAVLPAAIAADAARTGRVPAVGPSGARTDAAAASQEAGSSALRSNIVPFTPRSPSRAIPVQPAAGTSSPAAGSDRVVPALQRRPLPSPSVESFLSDNAASSPAGESPSSRAARIDKHRKLLDRSFSGPAAPPVIITGFNPVSAPAGAVFPASSAASAAAMHSATAAPSAAAMGCGFDAYDGAAVAEGFAAAGDGYAEASEDWGGDGASVHAAAFAPAPAALAEVTAEAAAAPAASAMPTAA